MANRNQTVLRAGSEANAQSGVRIEKILNDHDKNREAAGLTERTTDMNGDKGLYGETLRPSEREDSYEPGPVDNHRRTPSTREQ